RIAIVLVPDIASVQSMTRRDVPARRHDHLVIVAEIVEVLAAQRNKRGQRRTSPYVERRVIVIAAAQKTRRMIRAVAQAAAARIEIERAAPVAIVVDAVGPSPARGTDRPVGAAAPAERKPCFVARFDAAAHITAASLHATIARVAAGPRQIA